ncbi:oligoribonuclease [Thioalkalivibrio sp. HK1]|uniref:oligoribonuclease n=1 Tax=Thioalkalivibrio sp. HK1 TaxID=1469245 RepID=UPI000472462F|nr:oligoribonuclease [Thioalkalivibrio sp. HK1]
MNQSPKNLVWIDLEMTGLDPERENIIEIATVVTDESLDEAVEGPSIVIRQPKALLDKMDEWNTKQHGQSGLIDRVLASTCDLGQAEERTLAFLQKYLPPKVSPMCGNSICLDRRFLIRYMPRLEAFFHYRHLDVSTVKELCSRWAPSRFQSVVKESRHRAMQDIHDSIAELRFYREHFLVVDSPPGEGSSLGESPSSDESRSDD